MTAPAEGPAAQAPRLVLRLPGTWVQLDPSRPEVTDRRVRAYVDLAVGRADELAQVRAEMRAALGQIVEHQHEAAPIESLFLCHEIAPGVATPITVIVFAPAAMHMSPVIGTDPGAVIDGFLAAMDHLGDADGWERLSCVDGQAARRWRIDSTVIAEGTEDTPVRTFVAEYWRTVPQSKQLVLVTVSTPIADVPQTMLRLADAIVAGSRLRVPTA